jgi:hypothetical protein
VVAGKLIGKDAGNVGGLSSTYPKTFNQDTGHAGSNVPDGEVINIMQDEEHNGKNSLCNFCLHYFKTILEIYGARFNVVVKALCYKPEGRGFETR